MVKYKGQSSLKQYLPMNPIKRGFKEWMRADSSNGFISDLDMYTGKDGRLCHCQSRYESCGAAIASSGGRTLPSLP